MTSAIALLSINAIGWWVVVALIVFWKRGEKRAPTLPVDPAKRAKVVQSMVDARLITEARAEQLMESQEKDPDRCVCGCSLDNDHTPGGGCLNGCSPSQCVPDGAYQRYLKMTGGR